MAQHNILIVDDSFSTLQLLKRWLEFQHYNPIAARSGKLALEILEKEHIDCILLDVMMPEIDGITVCSIIKKDEALKHIPIIMITASRETDVRVKSTAAGADAFITKPIDFGLLAEMIKNQLFHPQHQLTMPTQFAKNFAFS